jgi:hypothetical protein
MLLGYAHCREIPQISGGIVYGGVPGHTHEAALLPANADFPCAQLTGGGPKPEHATWIEGKADGKELKLEIRNLDGKILHEASFPAMA